MADQTMTAGGTAAKSKASFRAIKRVHGSDLAARGEPFVWGMGGALAFGIMMITGFLILVLSFGIATFWPKPIHIVTTTGGQTYAGEAFRTEDFRPTPEVVAALPPAVQQEIADNFGYSTRTLYRVGNFDFYAEDFRWVAAYEKASDTLPTDFVWMERLEWGPFTGRITGLNLDGQVIADPTEEQIRAAHEAAVERRHAILDLKEGAVTKANKELTELRLDTRRAELRYGEGTAEAQAAAAENARRAEEISAQLTVDSAEVSRRQAEDERFTVTLTEVGGQTKDIPISDIVRFYYANDLGIGEKIGIYFSRWAEFVLSEPREANTEGGVMPAIVGTFTMTVLLALAVAPFGVMTALYLREYAKQGAIVSGVRIAVNNLAGVPSIVYGIFGLGFFAYILGGNIDALLFPERLPNPTFGTGGLLWASLTLALLTVPVVIVSTEEALAAVPRSMREGSLACGASKWQTIRWIVLPRAAPGVMTGLILAMARGAGEVAPLMVVGVVKLAPELPVDGTFPFIHFDRSFMHLGFHIYDVGFQSRNSEAGRPMVFVTTLVLILMVLMLNFAAITIRNRLKKKFAGDKF